MSQEEAQARLEVAQLYHEMGQVAKAVRYYMAAAEIYQAAGNAQRARELLQTVLQLDAGNEPATKQLEALGGSAPQPAEVAPTGSAASAAAIPQAGDSQAPAAGPIPGIHQPTPWLFTASELVAKIRSLVTSPPDPEKFRFRALPQLDPRAIERKVQEMEALRRREAEKSRTSVASAFGGGHEGSSIFGSGSSPAAGSSGKAGGFGNISGGRRRADSGEDSSGGGSRKKKRGAIRGGNRSLADSIRKRLGK